MYMYTLIFFLDRYFYLFSYMYIYYLYGRRGIAPTRNGTHILKNVLNILICIKLFFFLTIFLSLSDLFPWWI